MAAMSFKLKSQTADHCLHFKMESKLRQETAQIHAVILLIMVFRFLIILTQIHRN